MKKLFQPLNVVPVSAVDEGAYADARRFALDKKQGSFPITQEHVPAEVPVLVEADSGREARRGGSPKRLLGSQGKGLIILMITGMMMQVLYN